MPLILHGMIDLSKNIWAYCLKNAIEFGKVDSGKILPKLFQHGLDKRYIPEALAQIKEIAGKVNSMKPADRQIEFEKYKDFAVEHVEKEKGLPEIDVTGLKKVITRLAPEPSKYNHLGHALSFILNYIYSQRYKGKCLLRFEDTNPEKSEQEFVNAVKEDVLGYLGVKVDETKYVSDDMDLLYTYAGKLVKKGAAFICTCEREKMQDFRHKGMECECRQYQPSIQIKKWNDFLKGKYKEGAATLRLKGDMQSLNHVMRDPVLFRIINKKHYRHGKKYKVWPTYDFYNPIEDSIMGVTLILRTNEFDLRVELQDKIKELLNLKKQKIIQYGRFHVVDFTTQGREIRELIDSGQIGGWDDPRLVTLKSLKRRGIVREAFYELANQIGLSKHPVNLEFDMIAAINRKIIDPVSNRYSFISNPVKLEVVNMPVIKDIEIKIHPDKNELRKIKVNEIFVSGEDYNSLMNKEIRLIHLFNIKLGKKTEFTSEENKDIPKINWVSDNVKTQILMPDGKWKEGIAEKAIKELAVGDIIQFERFGFCRYEGKKKGVYSFVFGHK